MRRISILVIALLAGLAALAVAVDVRAQSVPERVFSTLTRPVQMIARSVAGRRFARARHHRRVMAARHRRTWILARHHHYRARLLARHNRPAAAQAAAAAGAAAGAAAASGPDSGSATSTDNAGNAGATGAGSATSSRNPGQRPERQATTGVQPEPQNPAGEARRRPQRPNPPPSAGASSWVGVVYWPRSPDDLFDYTFRPSSGGERFWAHGGRDLFDAMFMGGAANSGWPALCGSQRQGGANVWTDPIAKIVEPTDAQRPALDALGAALVKANDAVKGVCPPAATGATPSKRLGTMTNRVWALRRAAIIVRDPLDAFAKALDEGQNARLNGAAGNAERRDGAEKATTGAAPSGATRLCVDPAAAMAIWPGDQIERRVHPSAGQRQKLQTLEMTTQGMAQQLMASCPAEPPATALARLDAAEKRLNAILYATRIVGPALRGFYDSLTEEQKAEFNAISWWQSAGPTAGRGPNER